MKRLFLIFVAIVSLCSFSKRSIPVRMDNFVNEVEQNGDRYSAADWEKSTAEFEKLMDEYRNSEKDFSEEEKSMAIRAMGRYHALLLKHGFVKSRDYIRSLGKILPEYLEGFTSQISKGSGELRESFGSMIDTTALKASLEKLGAMLESLFGPKYETI